MGAYLILFARHRQYVVSAMSWGFIGKYLSKHMGLGWINSLWKEWHAICLPFNDKDGFRWDFVRVSWVGEAGSVWQVTAFTHSRCKNAGLAVACSPAVMFCVVYFVEPSDLESKAVQSCVAEQMLPVICSYLYVLVVEEKIVFMTVVFVLFLFRLSRTWEQ